MMGPALLEWRTVGTVAANEAEGIRAGVYALRVTAPSATGERGPGLSAQRCEELNSLAGVVAAGPTWGETDVELEPFRADLTPALALSPGALSVLAPDAPQVAISSEIVVGDRLADLMGLTSGQPIAGSGAVHQVAVVSDSRGARLTGAWAIVSSAALRPAGDCLVEIKPASFPWFTANNVGAWFGENVTLASFSDDISQAEVLADYEGRLTRLLWAPLALAGALSVAVSMRARRESVAVYKLVGLGTEQVTMILGSELLLSWLAAFASTLTGLSIAEATGHIGVGLLDSLVLIARYSVTYLSLALAMAVLVARQPAHHVLQTGDG